MKVAAQAIFDKCVGPQGGYGGLAGVLLRDGQQTGWRVSVAARKVWPAKESGLLEEC